MNSFWCEIKSCTVEVFAGIKAGSGREVGWEYTSSGSFATKPWALVMTVMIACAEECDVNTTCD